MGAMGSGEKIPPAADWKGNGRSVQQPLFSLKTKAFKQTPESLAVSSDRLCCHNCPQGRGWIPAESQTPFLASFLHQGKSVHPPQCPQRQAGCSLDSATVKVGGARKKEEHQGKLPAVRTAMLPRLKVLLLERKFGHFGASFHRRQDFPSGG